MILIPPTANEWSQNNQTDDQNGSMVSTTRVMERTGQELQQQQQQQQQEALKCPRCDSSNTKFCYYNNYSLSQPRHFCKACKRYWTRGGTLRNVPVGGGCRKNKRIKRPNSSPADGAMCTSSANSVPLANTNTTSDTQFDASSAANHVNSLLYGLSSNPCDMNLPFYRLNSRVSSLDSTVPCYDLQPQLHALGLAFSHRVSETDNQNGFIKCNPTNQNHDMVASTAPYLSNYFGGSTSTRTTPIVASSLTSTLQQQKFLMKDSPLINNFQGLTPFEELQISGANYGGTQTNGLALSKQVKVEQGKSRIDWNAFNCQTEMDQAGGMPEADPSFYWNTATTLGTWNDQPNTGPSVTSLI